MKKIFIFCESDPNKEPRVIRTIETLSGNFEITVCGYLPYKNLNFFDVGKFIEQKKIVSFHLKLPALIRKLISAFLNLFYYKKSDNILNPLLNIEKTAEALSKLKPNVIICHGLGFLQLCSYMKTDEIKLILNAHEYYPAEFEHEESWKEMGERYKLILKKYARQIDLIFSVNGTIGERYEKEFKIPFVEVINAPDYVEDIIPSEVVSPIKIVHHGSALANRKIEVMIDAILSSTLSCELHLVLVPTEKEYYEFLRIKYRLEKRIIFSEPVNVKDISKNINRYDLGIYLLPPLNFNNLNALPNKFFEFIQARLAILISPNPEMKKLVEQYNLGCVTADFSPASLTGSLNSLTLERIREYKNNSQKFAKELSSIKTKQVMLAAVNQLCAA